MLFNNNNYKRIILISVFTVIGITLLYILVDAMNRQGYEEKYGDLPRREASFGKSDVEVQYANSNQ